VGFYKQLLCHFDTWAVALSLQPLAGVLFTSGGMRLNHSKLYRTEVAVISASSPIAEAAKLMRDYRVGSIVVIQLNSDGSFSPIGLLTDRDIVTELVAEEIDLKTVLVADIMSPDPITVRHTAQLDEMVKIMRQYNVRRLPVVDERRHLVGFVSFDDLLERVGFELSSLSQISQGQNKFEKELRPPRFTRPL
jgi:CBS domain-containing protein